MSPGKNAGPAPIAVSSPDGSLAISLSVVSKPQPYLPGDRIYYRVSYKGTPVLEDSPLGLDFTDGPALDRDFDVVSVAKRSNDSTWENAFGAQRTVPDRYNEIVVSLEEQIKPYRRLDVVLRAYDEGVAFRYVVPKQDLTEEFNLAAENTGFYFAADAFAYALNMGRWDTHNEGPYERILVREIKPASLVNLPLLVEMPGPKLWAAILEADLTDYAGMYVGGVPEMPNALTSRLAIAPKRRLDQPVIAQLPKATPWRVIMVGTDPGRFIETNYLVLNLSAPCAIADTSWIKPGKAAWDWWSGSYATGVDFKPGMNTATMKHYIDFAARHGLDYMLVDAGWAPIAEDGRIEDILRYRPEVDVPGIIAYGKSKGVETLLWVEWRALDRHMDEAMALYEKWGAAGIKVDYMNRDDQEMVNYYEKVVKTAAAHRLTVDLHGAYKPTGLRRAYPNLLTREGVMGLEYSKWSENITPEYDVTIPFTRMLAGPMDYTPGAFRNAAKGRFEAKRHRADVAGDAGPPAGHVCCLREPSRHGLRLSGGVRGPAGIRIHREGADRVGRNPIPGRRAGSIHRPGPEKWRQLVRGGNDELGSAHVRSPARLPRRRRIRGHDLRRRPGCRDGRDEPRYFEEDGHGRRPADPQAGPRRRRGRSHWGRTTEIA